MTESVFCLSLSPDSEIEKELWELLHYFDDTEGYIEWPFSPICERLLFLRHKFDFFFR